MYTDTKLNNIITFYSYIRCNGYNPLNYERTLELFSSPRESMSQFLVKYKQYLLSTKVNYYDLEDLGLDGARGFLIADGILVPESFEKDEHFLHASKTIHTKHSYNIPSMEEFGAIIGNGFGSDIIIAPRLDKDLFIGMCIDEEEINENIYAIETYKKLTLNPNLEYHEDSIYGKKLYLIKKSN